MIIPTPEFDPLFAEDGISFRAKMIEYIKREFADLLGPRIGLLQSAEGLETLARLCRPEKSVHICSHVEGRLDPRRDAMDALLAGFPAGTLSGAPKVRAMEIIDALEPERRNLYGGAIGYFAGDGSLDTCIVLRTAIVKDGRMIVQAGCGVVADSDPAAEYQEILDKARALFRAAEEAVRFARG
jgi:anthranilate synthase component 1